MRLFDDDHIIVGGVHYHAPAWPPPVYIRTQGETFLLANHSQITDKQREKMTNVCRGAEYARCDDSPWAVDVELVPLNAVTLLDYVEHFNDRT
jgi:hypothetical protein